MLAHSINLYYLKVDKNEYLQDHIFQFNNFYPIINSNDVLKNFSSTIQHPLQNWAKTPIFSKHKNDTRYFISGHAMLWITLSPRKEISRL